MVTETTFHLMVLLLILPRNNGEDYLVAVAHRQLNCKIHASAGATGGLLEILYPHYMYKRAMQLFSVSVLTSHINDKMVATYATENKAIIAAGSDSDITVTVECKEVMAPLPISALGTRYFIPSLSVSSGTFDSMLLVVTHNQSTHLDIAFRMTNGSVIVRGIVNRDGDSMSLVLGPYQTLMVTGNCDFRGTVITSTQTVAVYSGLGARDELYDMYDQLLPAGHYGQEEYVVAVDDNYDIFFMCVSTEHSDTQLIISGAETIIVGNSHFYQRSLGRNETLHLKSNRPITISLGSTGNIKPGFVIIPPVTTYLKRMHTFFQRHQRVKILIEKPANLEIETRQMDTFLVDWQDVPGSKYRVATAEKTSSGYVCISSESPFTILSFREGKFRKYGYNFSQKASVSTLNIGQTYLMTFTESSPIPVIHATSGEAKCQWQIQNPRTGQIWSRHFSSYSTDNFHVYGVINISNGMDDKSVLVHVKDDETVIDGGVAYTEYSPLPIAALGTKYIVSSCTHGEGYSSMIVIATHSQKTVVDVAFRLEGNVTYGNKLYGDGDTLTLILDQYQTATITTRSDITGTRITSVETVAVFSATYKFGNKRGNKYPLSTYEQLHPVRLYGKEFVLAIKDDSDYRLSSHPYQLQVVSEDSDTQIVFNDGTTISFGETGIFRKNYNVHTNISFNTTRPVMATLCSVGSSSFGPAMDGCFLIPPLTHYLKHAYFSGRGTLQLLTAEDNHNIRVQMSQTLGFALDNVKIAWNNVPGTRYKVGTFTSRSRQIFIRSDDPFTVLGYSKARIYNTGCSLTSAQVTRVWIYIWICCGCVAVALLVTFAVYMRKGMMSIDDPRHDNEPSTTQNVSVDTSVPGTPRAANTSCQHKLPTQTANTSCQHKLPTQAANTSLLDIDTSSNIVTYYNSQQET